MGKYIISCCSTADLTKEHFEAIDVKYICFHFEIDGKQYPDDLGVSYPFHDFYNKMAEGAMTRTSQINADEFQAFFKPYLDEGYDILHLSLSSGISGVVNSAYIARDLLQDDYPDRKIYVVDSLAASSGYGLFMDKLAELRDEGKTIDELYEWAEANKLTMQHWFFTTDLTYLIRGGRVSKAAGAIGKMLNICPLLNVDFEGKLIARHKLRGKKNVIKATVEKMVELADGGLEYADKCFISQSDCVEDAKAVATMIEEKFPKLKGKVEIDYIGTTIGSHTGPGTVALFFWGKKRVD